MEETYIDRMVKEEAELKDRTLKLIAFMESDEFGKLDDTEKRLLRMQYAAMETYLTSLTSRLLYEDAKRYEGDIKALKAQADEWLKEGKTDDEIAAMCFERMQAIPSIGKEQINDFVAAETCRQRRYGKN